MEEVVTAEVVVAVEGEVVEVEVVVVVVVVEEEVVEGTTRAASFFSSSCVCMYVCMRQG